MAMNGEIIGINGGGGGMAKNINGGAAAKAANEERAGAGVRRGESMAAGVSGGVAKWRLSGKRRHENQQSNGGAVGGQRK